MLSTVSPVVSLLGSSLLLLPLSLVFAAVLWRLDATRMAFRWSAALGAMLATMTVLKLYGHACGLPVLFERITSPSGHAAFAAFFYGSVAVVLVRATVATWRRIAILAAAAALVAAIGASRVVLQAHDRVEVLVGFVVGGSSALAFALCSLSHPPVRLRLNLPLAAAVLACGLAVLSAGDLGIVEDAIRLVAAQLQQDAALCPAPALADSGGGMALR